MPIYGGGGSGLTAIADKDLLANTSGASAVPVATTASAYLDSALGSIQGQILYRGASSWTALGAGTSGQFLKTLGAAANPAWADVTAGSGDMFATLVNTEVSITGATTLTSTAFGKMHVCSGTSADYTVGLPAVSGNTGKIIGFRMDSALTKLVTIDGNASETIDGTTTRIMWAKETAILYCDGTTWTKIAGKSMPMSAVMKRAASQSISDATNTKVSMDTTVSDNTGFMADTTNGLVNIKRPGIYQCSGYCSLAGLSNGHDIAGGVAKNTAPGGADPNASMEFTSPSAGFVGASAGAPFVCVAGDTVMTWIYQSSGGSKSTRTVTSVMPTLAVAEIPSW